MKATLDCDYCWRGVVYAKGEREIPEDLAIAFGRSAAEPVAPAENSATVADLSEPPPTKPKRRR